MIIGKILAIILLFVMAFVGLETLCIAIIGKTIFQILKESEEKE